MNDLLEGLLLSSRATEETEKGRTEAARPSLTDSVCWNSCLSCGRIILGAVEEMVEIQRGTTFGKDSVGVSPL